MEGIDEKDRRKFMAICIGLCMLAYFVAKWATTQVIAGELAYPEELSGQIFWHVYQPFSIDAWRMDEGLSIGVQRVIRRYVSGNGCSPWQGRLPVIWPTSIFLA